MTTPRIFSPTNLRNSGDVLFAYWMRWGLGQLRSSYCRGLWLVGGWMLGCVCHALSYRFREWARVWFLLASGLIREPKPYFHLQIF